MSPERRRAIGVTLLALLVLAFAFLPWGRVPVRPFGADLGLDQLPGFPSITLDGWHGSITPHAYSFAVELPNWLVVLAALVVAALCWLRCQGVWRVPAPFMILLVAYGLAHSLGVPLGLAAAEGSSAAIGGFLTAATWVAIALVLARTRPAAPGVDGPRV